MPPHEYRPRNGTELIDAAFQLVRSQFPTLLTIVAIGSLPALVAALVVPAPSLLHPGRAFLTNIANAVTVLLIQGSLLVALSEVYLGHPIAVGPSVSAGFHNMRRLFNANAVTGILFALALLLLVVPGLIVFAWLFVVPAIVVLERIPVTQGALSRSRMLCGDTKLRILGLGLVFVLVLLIGGALAGAIGMWAGSALLTALLGTITQAVAWTLYMAFVIVQYYDARIRKEGFDVELMARTLPSPEQPDLASA